MAATAQITFPGGGLFVPAQTPYERQQLVEHLRGCLRSAGHARVRLDRTTWFIERADSERPVCAGCKEQIRDTVCHRSGKAGVLYCPTCAMVRPHLTIAFLSALPEGTILRDVHAQYAYGGEWIAWTRWPQATPAEIINDIHLQRRFAPVLTWHCTEICLPEEPQEPRATAAADAAKPPLRAAQR